MGCFNIGGFYTQQEISFGMPCVAFICCEFDKKGLWSSSHYSIPLSMPIFGTYDDYGRIEDIKDSSTVADIEKFFGYNIDDVIDDLTEFQKTFLDRHGRYDQIVDLRKKDPNESFMKEEFDRFVPIYEKIRDSLGEDIENFNIFLAIDHEAVWEVFSKDYSCYYDNDDDGEYTPPDYNLEEIKDIFNCCVNEYETYSSEDFSETILCIHSDLSQDEINEFGNFVELSKYADLEFKFRPSYAWSQDSHTKEFAELNKLLTKVYEERLD